MSLRTFGQPSRIQTAKLNMQGNLALTQNEAMAAFNAIDETISTRMQVGQVGYAAMLRARDKIRRALEITEGKI